MFIWWENKNIYRSVKLNNMIPLPTKHKQLLKTIDFNVLKSSKELADRQYGTLLEKQHIKLNDVSIKYQILSKAQKFYRSYSFNPKLKLLCCDFKMLEQKALEFSLSKDKKRKDYRARRRVSEISYFLLLLSICFGLFSFFWSLLIASSYFWFKYFISILRSSFDSRTLFWLMPFNLW